MGKMLKEALAELPKRHLVRIGTTAGSNFIYAGPVAGISWDALYEKYTRWLNEEEKKAFVRFEERIVVDEYPSLRTAAELFLIAGTESPPADEDGNLMLPKELQDISDLGVENLAIAISKRVVEDLIGEYKQIKYHRAEYVSAVQRSAKLEQYVRCDGLMMLKDPDAIIEMARKEVFGEAMI